jgi:peptidoglycan DL-endopeptidase CwlO
MLGGTVHLRDGTRRTLLTLGTGLAVLTMAAAMDAPSALAASAGSAAPAGLAASAGSAAPAGLAAPAARAGGLTGAGIHGGAGAGAGEPVLPGGSSSDSQPVDVARLSRSASARTSLAPLHQLLQADLLVVAPTTLPSGLATAVHRLHGVVAAQPVDAARLDVNGQLIAMLGVDPSAFRAFAAKPTAESAGLWENVAAGGVAVSYTMGKLDKLSLAHPIKVTGRKVEELPVAGLGTVGIGGVDAVVSDTVARSLGIPADNAVVVSAPHADLTSLTHQIDKLLPHGAAVATLVAQSTTSGVAETSGAAGAAGSTSADGPGLTSTEVIAFLKAAESRIGLPYVWGGDGPNVFDCSGLVQWSLAQAGVVMPRVAAAQATAGPLVPVSDLEPGDLLFYHTDPTAPTYISHVAIYIGDGLMEQAPEPGLDVEVVPADFGSEFAGAIAVYPRVAASVAADPAG